MRYTLHTFRPSETIDAVIRLKGRHNLTKEQLIPLRQEFNRLNGFVVPRQGTTYKIPLPFDVTDDYGNVIDVTPELDPISDSENTDQGLSDQSS
jgi:hypothetical protein